MKEATKHEWTLIVSGEDRSTLSQAFRGTQWQDTWFNRASPMEDNDPDAGMSVSLSIPDLDTLIAAIKCVGNLRPTYGIALYMNADFDALKAEVHLCTKGSGFSVSACTIHRTAKSLKSEAQSRLGEAQRVLADLGQLLAESEASGE